MTWDLLFLSHPGPATVRRSPGGRATPPPLNPPSSPGIEWPRSATLTPGRHVRGAAPVCQPGHGGTVAAGRYRTARRPSQPSGCVAPLEGSRVEPAHPGGGVGGFGVALPSHRPDTPSRTRGGGMTEMSGSTHARPRSRDNPRPDARIAQLGETPRRGGCSGNLEACSSDRASRVARSGGDPEDGDGRSRQGLRPIS